MEILPSLEIKGVISQPVKNYKVIQKEAEEFIKFIDDFPGKNGRKPFSLAHAQVSTEPYTMFVVREEFVKQGLLKHRLIINPEIVEGTEAEQTMLREACMSFPFRDPIKVRRFTKLTARYQTPGFFGLKTVVVELKDMVAQMFQHEIDHFNGKNIYFKN